MENDKKQVSDAQKAAQKRYDQNRTKMVSVKYTPMDMGDYYELKKYLDESGESANGLIKELVHTFLTNKDKNVTFHGVKNRSSSKTKEQEYYHPYKKVNSDTIEYLYQNLGREGTDTLLDEYRKQSEDVAIEQYTEKFEKFIERRVKRFIRENPSYSCDGKILEALRLLSVYPPSIMVS